jgi:membrane protease YdiL (CAAX protease family)
MARSKRTISFSRAAAIFGTATAYFYLLLFTLYPFLKSNYSLNPSLYWFITGYFLFIPLFLFSIIMVRREGNRSIAEILNALNINKLSYKDWLYAIIGTVLIFLLSGAIYGFSWLLNRYCGIGLINTTPWFMEEMRPFEGVERLLLLVWLSMFFFNIVGEELLWRGYIQNRMEGKYVWLKCSLLWAVFHLPFGFDIMIIALPALLIIPYIFSKRDNTVISMFIHGAYNGPIFVLIALGLIK